jgi:hypothetical protein
MIFLNNDTQLLVLSDQSDYDAKIKDALSNYVEKTFNEGGSVNYKKVPTTYFLDNNVWHMDFFRSIAQFENISSNVSTISFRLYQQIYTKIKEGNIVYSRLDRLKSKGI